MSLQWDDWIAKARRVAIDDVISARGGLRLKRANREFVGPCPHCGGTDRFAVSLPKSIFNCRGCGATGDVISFVQFLDACDFEHAVETLTGEPKPNAAKRSIVAVYDYTDENDTIQFQVVRFEPKDFRQRRPDGNGGWIWDLHGVRLVPYRLPQLLEAIASEHPVLVVEGEKDVHTAERGLGLVATCNAMGAGKWRDAYDAHFAHADVVIVPDNDEAGQRHAQSVAKHLRKVARRVRLLALTAKDLTAWVEAGGTREALDELIAGAPDYAGEEATPDGSPVVHWHGEADPRESRSWFIQDLIPEVGKGLIAGQWGLYKTFVALDLAHCAMTGTPFLGFEVVRRGGVLFIALEGQGEIAIRLQAAIEHGGKIPGRAPFAWIETCPPLLAANAVPELGKVIEYVATKLQADFGLPLVMIVIDTIILAAGYTKNSEDNDASTTNMLFAAMARLADKGACFVFGVDHFGKAVDTGTRGSSAKEGNADVVIALLGDKDIAGAVKNCRLALRKRRSGPNGEEFPFAPRLVDMGHDLRGKTITTLVLDWGSEPKPTAARNGADWGRGKSVKLLRRTVMALLADCGTDQRPWADGPLVRTLKVDIVREEFCKGWFADGDSPRAKRQAKVTAFRRAMADAADRGVIVTRDIGGEDLVWLATAPRE